MEKHNDPGVSLTTSHFPIEPNHVWSDNVTLRGALHRPYSVAPYTDLPEEYLDMLQDDNERRNEVTRREIKGTVETRLRSLEQSTRFDQDNGPVETAMDALASSCSDDKNQQRRAYATLREGLDESIVSKTSLVSVTPRQREKAHTFIDQRLADEETEVLETVIENYNSMNEDRGKRRRNREGRLEKKRAVRQAFSNGYNDVEAVRILYRERSSQPVTVPNVKTSVEIDKGYVERVGGQRRAKELARSGSCLGPVTPVYESNDDLPSISSETAPPLPDADER